MGKVIVQATMSLDGYIADPSDAVGPHFFGDYAGSPLLLHDLRLAQEQRVTHLRYRVR